MPPSPPHIKRTSSLLDCILPLLYILLQKDIALIRLNLLPQLPTRCIYEVTIKYPRVHPQFHGAETFEIKVSGRKKNCSRFVEPKCPGRIQPGHYLQVVAFIAFTPNPSKQFCSLHLPCVVRIFQATGNITAGTRTHHKFSRLLPLFTQSYCRSKQLCSWRRFSVVIIFQATEKNFTGTRTWNICLEFCCFREVFLVSRHKPQKPEANWPIPSRSIRVHIYIRHHNFNFTYEKEGVLRFRLQTMVSINRDAFDVLIHYLIGLHIKDYVQLTRTKDIQEQPQFNIYKYSKYMLCKQMERYIGT